MDCFSSTLERVGIPGPGAQMVPRKGHRGIRCPGGTTELDLHLSSGRQEAGDRRGPAHQFLTSHPPMGRNPRPGF